MPTQEEAAEITFGARNLKEGVDLMQFFVDSRVFKEGFSHNFLIEFLSIIYQRGLEQSARDQKMRKNNLGEIAGYGLVILPKK